MFRKILFLSLLLLMVISFLPHPIQAQDNSAPITATVTVENLYIRYAPTNIYWLDEDSTLIGQLHYGDEVIVHSYEGVRSYYSANRDYPWVYVSHEASGLTGWVYSRYLYFSDDNWQEILPHVDTWYDLGYEVSTNTQPFPAVVWLQGASTYLRAEPHYGAAFTYLVPPTQPVTVVGSAKINGVIRFVYVKATDSEAEGWVVSLKVRPAIWDAYEGWEKALPVLVERDLRVDYADYPQATVVVNMTYSSRALRVRSGPSTDSEIIEAIPTGAHLAIHGRTNHDVEGWVYVTVIDVQDRYWWDYSRLGLSGWVFDPNWDAPYLRYDDGVLRTDLPILTP